MESVNLPFSLKRLHGIIKTYPLPSFAFIGLMLGITVFFLVSGSSANIVWYVTLVIGGAPLVYQTIRKMLSGRFAADVVAMLAILVSIILQQSFAGAIIVLMQSSG